MKPNGKDDLHQEARGEISVSIPAGKAWVFGIEKQSGDGAYDDHFGQCVGSSD